MMKRIRLSEDVFEMLQGFAEPGESVQDTLQRVLELRYIETAYPDKLGLSYKDLAERWDCSVSLVKLRVAKYRDSGGKVGLGPVRKLGARKVLVPWESIREYEKRGVW